MTLVSMVFTIVVYYSSNIFVAAVILSNEPYHFRYFMYIWQETKDRLFFVYMVEVIAGKF